MKAIYTVRKIKAMGVSERGYEALKGTTEIWLRNPWNLIEHHYNRRSIPA